MKKIAIVGASGHGKVVAELAELLDYEVIFYDDNYPSKKSVEQWNIVGCFNDLLNAHNTIHYAFVAIGNNVVREKLAAKLKSFGFEFATLVHPSAVVSKSVCIEFGTVVMANVVINAFSKIGNNCIINSGTIVEHDCNIGNSVHLSPRVALAGGTIINDLSWLGIGTVTRQNIQVGKKSVIGANSTVINNIPENVVAFGTPARIKDLNQC